MIELNCCNRDHKTLETESIYYLNYYRQKKKKGGGFKMHLRKLSTGNPIAWIKIAPFLCTDLEVLDYTWPVFKLKFFSCIKWA